MDHAVGLQVFNRKWLFVTSLFLTWVLGLMTGIALCDMRYIPILSSAILQPASTLGILFVIFLPFLMVRLCFLINQQLFIFIVFFLKAVAFGFTGVLITNCYNSASWIVRLLFQFSDYCGIALLFASVFHYLDVFGKGRKNKYSIIFFLAIFAATIDYYLISPFLQEIL